VGAEALLSALLHAQRVGAALLPLPCSAHAAASLRARLHAAASEVHRDDACSWQHRRRQFRHDEGS
jgi:hypothetical protein